MTVSNYHGHCRYCNGAGEPEEYVQEALKRGFSAMGFSSHAPVKGEEWCMDEADLPRYSSEVLRLKEAYRDRLQIYLGLEIDYLASSDLPLRERFSEVKLDYCIGSFHMFEHGGKYWAVDGPEEHYMYNLNEIYRGSMAALSEGYYSHVAAMMKQGGFDILGHMDLIKKKNRGNRYFREDSPWYQNQIRKILDEIKLWGGLLEVNTGGISRGAIDTVYPSPWILHGAVQRGIPLVLNSDTHRPEHIDFYFTESMGILKDAGARELWHLLDGRWQKEAIQG